MSNSQTKVTHRSFREIYETAVLHKGGVDVVEAGLPKAKSARALKAIKDDRYLSNMSLRIFRAGLKHEMVDKKWPAFEEVFQGFDPVYCARLSDEALEGLMSERKIIRHFGKIKSVRANAQFICDVAEELGSFGAYLAAWPTNDIVSLWIQLKKRGNQLGGQSGARFLRMVGKDTFILTDDVVAVLKALEVVHKAPTSQRDMQAAQAGFNQWQEESGRDLCAISRVVSMTTLQ